MTPLRVLVVEDDPQMSCYLCALLTGWGHECIATSSAKAALDVVGMECPDVVLSDLVMPGMSGVELLQALKAKDCKQRFNCGPIFFILVTGHGSVSSAVRAIMEGADEVLLKPVDEVKLCAMLEGVRTNRNRTRT